MEETLPSASATPASPFRRLAAAQLVNSVGDGGFYVAGAVVFHQLLGLSAAQIGLTLTLAWTGGFLLTTPIGRLADRFGPKRVAITLALVTAAATLALLATAPGWSFLAVMVAYAVAQSGLHAVRQALVIALVAPAERTRFRARLQAQLNIGIGVGAAVGGLALLAATPAAYTGVLVLDAVGFLVAAGLMVRLPATPPGPRTTGPAARRDGRRPTVWHDRPYLVVAALTAVLYLYMPVLSVVLPLFVVQRTRAPTWVVAVAFVVNTLGVVTLQLRASRRVTDLRSAARSTRRGGIGLAVGCLVFGCAALPTDPGLAAAIVLAGAVVQVVGEVWFAAGSWELGFSLADPQRPGEWQGLFNANIPVARAVGPLLLTVLVVDWSGPGWLVLAAVLLAAAATTAPAVRWAGARRSSLPTYSTEVDHAPLHS